MESEDFTIVPLPVWFCFLVAILFWWPFSAAADPLYLAEVGAVRITLYSEPCELKEVTNLKLKATWVEKGKVSQGCWAATQFGVVVAYFDDRTIATIPVQAFEKVLGV
jgi:hypothetical protein